MTTTNIKTVSSEIIQLVFRNRELIEALLNLSVSDSTFPHIDPFLMTLNENEKNLFPVVKKYLEDFFTLLDKIIEEKEDKHLIKGNIESLKVVEQTILVIKNESDYPTFFKLLNDKEKIEGLKLSRILEKLV